MNPRPAGAPCNLAHSESSHSGVTLLPVPTMPRAPARATSRARSPPAAPAIGAWMIGYLSPNRRWSAEVAGILASLPYW